MELTNNTLYPAEVFRTGIDESRIAASVVAKATFRIVDGELVPDQEDPWQVCAGPYETEYGPMDGDEVFYKGGVDIFLFGCACALDGMRVSTQEVSIQVGAFSRRILVFGDRIWEKKRRKLVISEPEPFESIPLTYSNAFGGKGLWDGLEMPSPHNPDGKGLYLSEADAEGNPLPNMEDPENQVEKWDDQPDPVGVTPYPMHWGLRLANGSTMDPEAEVFEIHPTLFNSAHPNMIAQEVLPGDDVVIEGVKASGPLEFRIPDLRFRATLCLGDQSWENYLSIDGIGIESERDRVFIAYRYPFRYKVIPLQVRKLFLDLVESAI